MCNKIKTYNFYEIILINEAKVLVDKIGLFVMVLKFANYLVTTEFTLFTRKKNMAFTYITNYFNGENLNC